MCKLPRSWTSALDRGMSPRYGHCCGGPAHRPRRQEEGAKARSQFKKKKSHRDRAQCAPAKVRPKKVARRKEKAKKGRKQEKEAGVKGLHAGPRRRSLPAKPAAQAGRLHGPPGRVPTLDSPRPGQRGHVAQNPPARPPTGGWTPPAGAADDGAPRPSAAVWRAGFGPRPGRPPSRASPAMGLGRRAIAELGSTPSASRNARRPRAARRPPAVATGSPTDLLTATTPPVVDGSHGPLRPARWFERMALVWPTTGSRARRRQVQGRPDCWGMNAFVPPCGARLRSHLLARTHPRSIRRFLLVFLGRTSTNRTRGRRKENYAPRGVMELFTLGAIRRAGEAYTEDGTSRQAAKALTGLWLPLRLRRPRSAFTKLPLRRPRVTDNHHQERSSGKKRGTSRGRDLCSLCLQHPLCHPVVLRDKLWSYLVPVAPDQQTAGHVQAAYVNSG